MFRAGLGPGGDGDGGPVGPDTPVWALHASPWSWQRHASEAVLRSARLVCRGSWGLSSSLPAEWPRASGCLFPSSHPTPCSSALGVAGRRVPGCLQTRRCRVLQGTAESGRASRVQGAEVALGRHLLPRGRGLSSFGAHVFPDLPRCKRWESQSKVFFSLRFFLLFLVSRCLLGPAARSLGLKDRRASPGQHTGRGARPRGCSLSEGRLFTGP